MAGLFRLFVLVQVCLTHLLLYHTPVSALSHKYKRTANTTLGHMFKRFRCCAACFRDQGCHGVSYTPDSGRCELNWWPDFTIPVISDSTGVYVYSHECLVPWVLFEGHCYLFSMTERTWTDSRDYCRGMGSELVDIQSDAENTFVKDKAITLRLQDLWVGGVYYWSYWGSATWWSKNLGDQNCIKIDKSYNYGWIDCPCDRLYACSCEMVLP